MKLLAIAAGLSVATVAIAVQGQQFRDERTGQVWTPDNVGEDSRPLPSNQPRSAADRAFDPTAQVATASGIEIQRPTASLAGTVPITAGPTVPVAVLESPSLQVVPGDRWVAPLYVTNNSAGDVNAEVGCTFTNGGRAVQETRVVVPTAHAGQRLATAVYGPRAEIFVDRVLCRLLTP